MSGTIVGVVLLLLAYFAVCSSATACLHVVGAAGSDPATTAFTRIPDSPLRSTDASCVQAADKLFIFGGYLALDELNQLIPTPDAWALDLNTSTWTRVASAPFNGSRSQAASNSTHIFLVGGFEGNAPGTTRTGAHIYDIAKNSWSDLPSLPVAAGAGGLVLNGNSLMYISGQLSSGVYSADVFILDLNAIASGWVNASLTPFPSPRADFLALSVTARQPIVINAGGNIGPDIAPTDLNSTIGFDQILSSFSPLADMPVPRSHYGGVVAATGGPSNCCPGRVILLGGRSQQDATVLSTVVEYSPEENVWTTIALLPRQWYSPCAAYHTNATGSFLFVTGGGIDFFFPTNDSYVAPIAPSCNAPTNPVIPTVPPSPPAVTVPPTIGGGVTSTAAASAAAAAAAAATTANAAATSTAAASTATGAAATAAAASTTAAASSTTAAATTGTTPPPSTAPPTTAPPTTAPPTTAPPTTAPTTTTSTFGKFTLKPSFTFATLTGIIDPTTTTASTKPPSSSGFTIKPSTGIFTGLFTKPPPATIKPVITGFTFSAPLSPASVSDLSGATALGSIAALIAMCAALLIAV